MGIGKNASTVMQLQRAFKLIAAYTIDTVPNPWKHVLK